MSARSERDLLEERARALARPPVSSTGDTVELLTFGLGRETYALPSHYVQQVFRLTQLSPLPGAVPPVFGITAWRGVLLTVLDLRPVLGLSAAALDDLGHVIVLGQDGPPCGILADRVHEIHVIPRSAVHQPAEGVALRRDYVQGITSDAVVVLAGDEVLALNH